MYEVAYPTTGVEGGADGSIVEGDDLADVVDVRAGAVGEHGAAAGEPELFAFDADPVLHRLLDGELLVRHVGEPRDVAAGRPRERVAVPLGRRHEAPEPLALRRAVPLPVHEPVPREPQRALDVLARRVLGVLGRARLVRAVHLARRHLHPLRGMVRREVERRGRRGGAAAAAVAMERRGGGDAGDGGGGGDGDGGGDAAGRGGGEAAVVPDADEVGHRAEHRDGREVEQGRAAAARGRHVQLRGGRAHRHGWLAASAAPAARSPLSPRLLWDWGDSPFCTTAPLAGCLKRLPPRKDWGRGDRLIRWR